MELHNQLKTKVVSSQTVRCGTIPATFSGVLSRVASWKGEVALPDTEVRKAKARDKAHRMGDGTGLDLWSKLLEHRSGWVQIQSIAKINHEILARPLSATE